MNELLPSFQEEDGVSHEGIDGLPNGHGRMPSDVLKGGQGQSTPLFPEVDTLLALFKDSCKELIDLRHQVLDLD